MMKQKENFYTLRLDGNPSTWSVSSILNKFKTYPKNSRESELLEGAVFGKCLEIWTKKEIFITLVDEEKTNYKGIDFFLCKKNDIKRHFAFQLLEYKLRYIGIKNTCDFADWVIEKKFNKGDIKVHLLVTIASNVEFPLDLEVLKNKFCSSPFSSVTLMGPVKIKDCPVEFGHIIVGLNKNFFQTIVDLRNNQIIGFSDECPFFR